MIFKLPLSLIDTLYFIMLKTALCITIVLLKYCIEIYVNEISLTLNLLTVRGSLCTLVNQFIRNTENALFRFWI